MVGGVTRSTSSTSVASTSGNRGKNAYEVARQHLGKNAAQLKVDNTDVGLAMHDGIPNDINCANFVSGVLEATGQINASQHSDSAAGLAGNLGRDGNWESVSIENAKPGDVVLMNTGHSNHIVIFAGRTPDGKPLFIGSNNANADGSQRVTIGQMNYRITSVHHFKGGPEVAGATEGAAPSSGLPTGGSGGGGGDASGDYSPATNKFTYGYHPPAPGTEGPVLKPGESPLSASKMTMDELFAWVEQNLWQKMQTRLASLDADPEFKKFLEKKGVKPGEKITNAMRKEFLAEKLGKEMESRTGDDKDVNKAGEAVLDSFEEAPEATDATGGTQEASTGSDAQATTTAAALSLTVSRYSEPMRA